MVNMNMMVNTSDLLNEADTEKNNKIAQKKALSKLLAAWESKSAQKAKTYGGLGFLAVSLAACNSGTDDEPEAAAPTTPTTTTTTIRNFTRGCRFANHNPNASRSISSSSSSAEPAPVAFS